MRTRTQGMAIVQTLFLILLLMSVFTIMTRLTLMNLQQTGDSIQMTRTLALAQGGRNFAQTVLQGPVGAKLGDSIIYMAQNNMIGNAETWVFAAGYTTPRPPANVVAQGLTALAADVQPRLPGAGCYGPYTVSGSQQISLRITFTGTLPACDGQASSTVSIGRGRFISGARSSTQQYSLPYVMVVAASERGAKRTLTVNGEYRFNVGNGSFARYALLTDQHQQGTSASIYFTSRTLFNGPVHTNGNFAFRDTPWFGGAVSSSGVNDRGTPGGFFSTSTSTTPAFRTPTQLNPPSYGTTVPVFNNGVSWSAPTVPFPNNSNNQAAAAQQAGLYIPAGPSAVQLSVGLWPAGTPLANQKYQAITVGSTQYRAVADGPLYQLVNGTWQVALNASNQPINRFNGVIYAFGGISSLRGPARTTASNPNSSGPALASFSQITIAGNDDIRITGDLKYENNPCDGALTRNSDGSINVPDCSDDPLVQKNVLGIYASNGGDIKIGAGNTSSALNVPPDVQIHATMMADNEVNVENSTSASCSYGTAYILGGVIERKYGAFGQFNTSTGACTSGLGRSFTYDQRMLNGLAPPFFPTTTMTNLLVDRQVIQYGQSEQDRR
ncbi:DUF4900 domain-containing protein [Deinococcus hohokamensis]|uniref:DUF4900 domain-containing protein n=1 Tax=Deinococcus hohokamensis TaxID=309883 RepID=A0ABV9IE21_9DEIO